MTDQPEQDVRFRVAFTEQLRDLALEGKRNNYNRQLAWEDVESKLDPSGCHVLERILFHNDDHWRCWLLMKFKDQKEPMTVIIDVSLESWNQMLTPSQLKALANAVREN